MSCCRRLLLGPFRAYSHRPCREPAVSAIPAVFAIPPPGRMSLNIHDAVTDLELNLPVGLRGVCTDSDRDSMARWSKTRCLSQVRSHGPRRKPTVASLPLELTEPPATRVGLNVHDTVAYSQLNLPVGLRGVSTDSDRDSIPCSRWRSHRPTAARQRAPVVTAQPRTLGGSSAPL